MVTGSLKLSFPDVNKLMRWNVWCFYLKTKFFFPRVLFWQLWQFSINLTVWTIMTIFENLDQNYKDNPSDLWYLRTWIQFWIHVATWQLIVTLYSVQHSQLLQCFLIELSDSRFFKSKTKNDFLNIETYRDFWCSGKRWGRGAGWSVLQRTNLNKSKMAKPKQIKDINSFQKYFQQ